MNWFKQTLANVAGTQEPEYGPTAIQSVATQVQKKPWSEVTKSDLKWKAMESTCVETQVFYLISDTGTIAMAQLIYSNVGGIHTTCQFNCKIYDHNGPSNHLWCSDPLQNFGFDEDQVSLFADNCAVSLNDDATQYTIKSAVNEESIVNLTFTRTSPGFQAGENGTSYFGTDLANPWGSMRHLFWPRCKVEGSIITKEKEYDLKGKGCFIHALQGMKPHHAAAKWNFLTFQGPTHSAIMMEYTTPPSYALTNVNVGGIAQDAEIVCAGTLGPATHTATSQDAENDWPEPKAIKFDWKGTTKNGEEVSAEIAGSLGERLDRVDVLSHVPGLIKTLVGGVVGTKPYIYQYSPKDQLSLNIKIGDKESSEKGPIFAEATFIS